MRNTTRRFVIGAALFFVVGVVGYFDKQDQNDAQRHYCKMVQSGAWPDYRETYATECAKLTKE